LLALACWALPAIRGHLHARHKEMRLWEVMSRPAHLRAFAFTLAITMSSFVLVPFLPAFLEKNVGRSAADVGWMYFVGGAATLGAMNIAGRLSDRFSRRKLYRVMGLAVVIPFVWTTLLPPGASLTAVLTATTVLFILTSVRAVPAMALLTGCAAPRYRGRFLSVNASVQQLGLAAAPLLSGWLMGRTAEGEPLVGYPLAGLAASALAILSVVLIGWVRPAPKEEVAISPAELAVAASEV
jgi:predicted MFS family arabinose efflux permease